MKWRRQVEARGSTSDHTMSQAGSRTSQSLALRVESRGEQVNERLELHTRLCRDL